MAQEVGHHAGGVDAGAASDPGEDLPHVGRVQRCAQHGAEDQPLLAPKRAGGPPFSVLAVPVGDQAAASVGGSAKVRSPAVDRLTGPRWGEESGRCFIDPPPRRPPPPRTD